MAKTRGYRGEPDPKLLQPVRRDSWPESGDTYVADIRGLGIDESRFKYVPQGGLIELSPEGGVLSVYRGRQTTSEDRPLDHVGSEGFGFCSLAVIRTSDGRRIFSHVEPGADDFWQNMGSEPMGGRKWQSAQGVVGYGSVSSRASAEYYLEKGTWGPTEVSRIEVETGGAHWAATFDTRTDEVAIVRKTPDKKIFRFKPFG